MSKEAVKKVIGKLVDDKVFQDAFFNAPDEALADYQLTDEEKAGLKALKQDQVKDLSLKMDDQSLGAIRGGGPDSTWNEAYDTLDGGPCRPSGPRPSPRREDRRRNPDRGGGRGGGRY